MREYETTIGNSKILRLHYYTIADKDAVRHNGHIRLILKETDADEIWKLTEALDKISGRPEVALELDDGKRGSTIVDIGTLPPMDTAEITKEVLGILQEHEWIDEAEARKAYSDLRFDSSHAGHHAKTNRTVSIR